jgi:hypothetical protein
MNTHPYSVNHHLSMGTFDKNHRVRQREIFFFQMEAQWMVDHQPKVNQQAGWMNILSAEIWHFLALINRQLGKANYE